MSRSRYIIGIDLGTSNSAIAFVDTLDREPVSTVLPIKQRDTSSSERALPTMASALFFAPDDGREEVGAFARAHGALLPGRVIVSAKSWLAHGGVDRTQKILPWASDEIPDAAKLSPIDVSARFLSALKEAWNETQGAFHAEYGLEQQEITITVPASFDEAAQRLTLEAAARAGYPAGVRLLEEPQAAFYFWLEQIGSRGELARLIADRTGVLRVLVCDVGGGTTDFSLFEVDAVDGTAGRMRRVAVSDHLLLGGDNIDLAIAHHFEAKIDRKLTRSQWNELVFHSRVLKERALDPGDDEPASGDEPIHVSVASAGAGLFAGSLTLKTTKREIEALVLEGFFPHCERTERPVRPQAGLRELGLPYAVDSAVTRHLAQFLDSRDVDAVLFAGGSLKPQALKRRIVGAVTRWQGAEPLVLENGDLDLAVARGAAAYGFHLRTASMLIESNYARSVYLALEAEEDMRLLCVLPRGARANERFPLAGLRFKLRLEHPVEFKLYYSNQREHDAAGDLVSADPQVLHALPPLRTMLERRVGVVASGSNEIEVSLEAAVNELGLLQLYCVHTPVEGEPVRWNLDFNLRRESATEHSERTDAPDAQRLEAARERIRKYYGKAKQALGDESPRRLTRDLEAIFGARDGWPVATLRALWSPLRDGLTRRSRSLAHETTWLALAGFILRPGYGAELDPARMRELWRAFEIGLAHPKDSSAVVQWLIMWRRVAGGLDASQQEQIFRKIEPRLREKKRADHPELFRLASSLERLSHSGKKTVGELLLERLMQRTGPIEHFIWALGRLGSRIPLYAGPETALPPAVVERWVDAVERLDWSVPPYTELKTFALQVCRMTGDRSRDVEDEVRRRVEAKLRAAAASPADIEALRSASALGEGDKAKLFGESLPSGLRLIE